jgi:hypothetical protein
MQAISHFGLASHAMWQVARLYIRVRHYPTPYLGGTALTEVCLMLLLTLLRTQIKAFAY